ncbi:MAG: L-seryl-tRNA(Sec) selenium transferase [Chloroflexi bacterium]|nr:L-seryl-tRNA(Sec) selenium transferase [Chloroflexota bacterium]
MNQVLREIPSVDRVLGEPEVAMLVARYGRSATVSALRSVIEDVRAEALAGAAVPASNELVRRLTARLQRNLAPSLRRVINATGVVIHTNLGRALLSSEACAAMDAVARGYSTLEYDLEAGQRGHRFVHAERLLCELTGAESALVVNNNAGAVLLSLSGMAHGRGVVISRGQLVEIGGGFRVPDVMAQSGAALIEVGTTNRTHLRDYETAILEAEDVALILAAHHSNFRIVGFTGEPSIRDLVGLGERYELPILHDLGSGALLDTAAYGMMHEPTVQESIVDGAAVVTFSGDKLLGGPQAGIILGRAEYVEPLKSHPLARALRPDKICLAGLQATLLHYLRGEAAERVPVWRMIATTSASVEQRARRWRRALRRAHVDAVLVTGRSTVGGGSLPGETLPTTLVAVDDDSPDRLAAALRSGDPPVVARIESDRLVLDPRTVVEEEEAGLLEAVIAATRLREGER